MRRIRTTASWNESGSVEERPQGVHAVKEFHFKEAGKSASTISTTGMTTSTNPLIRATGNPLPAAGHECSAELPALAQDVHPARTSPVTIAAGCPVDQE